MGGLPARLFGLHGLNRSWCICIRGRVFYSVSLNRTIESGGGGGGGGEGKNGEEILDLR